MAGKQPWYHRIKDGEVTKCPACGGVLQEDHLLPIYQCTNRECCWNDESADLADGGMFTPPPGWKMRRRK